MFVSIYLCLLSPLLFLQTEKCDFTLRDAPKGTVFMPLSEHPVKFYSLDDGASNRRGMTGVAAKRKAKKTWRSNKKT